MGHRFAEIAFTDEVKRIQEEQGSRSSYAKMEARPGSHQDSHHVLGEAETAFIGARDSFYMATVSETGWPYVQHRGGPVGFVKVLGEKTLGFADFRGNRQYISVGNLRNNDRVSLFFMDYSSKTRLKLLGRARQIEEGDATTLEQLALPHYRARVERGLVIDVEAFDWNCPQHITPRFTSGEVDKLMLPLLQRIRELEAEFVRPAL